MISVIVATYGDVSWIEIGKERAYPSLPGQGLTDVWYNHAEHGSVSSSRNEGASYAKGEWLCFLDADDELAPGFIGAMGRALEQAGANGKRSLFTPAVQIVRAGRPAGVAHFFREVPLRQANWMVVGTLIHRDLFWEVGGFPEYPHGLEDWALWSKCVRVGAEVVKVPDAIYRYHANPRSKHNELWKDKKKQRAEHMRVLAELDEWEAARELVP